MKLRRTWATLLLREVDLCWRRVLRRRASPVERLVTLPRVQAPALFMNDHEEALVRYAVDPRAGYSVRTEKRLVVSAGPRLEVR